MSQSRQPKGVPVGGQYAENAHDDATADLDDWDELDDEDDDGYEYPPTQQEVDQAREYMEALGSQVPRPMYRGDWERVNGGSGPTLGQVRGEAEYRRRRTSEYEQARAEYERLRDAYEASHREEQGAGS